MKKAGVLMLCLALTGCDGHNDTQLITDTGKQLQKMIDDNPMRAQCEEIAGGREWLSHKKLARLEAKGCDRVMRSATETNFIDNHIYRRDITVVCGSIVGKSFTGEKIIRRYIYSADEHVLVLEPETDSDKTPFENFKTLQQLKENFQRHLTRYCQ